MIKNCLKIEKKLLAFSWTRIFDASKYRITSLSGLLKIRDYCVFSHLSRSIPPIRLFTCGFISLNFRGDNSMCNCRQDVQKTNERLDPDYSCQKWHTQKYAHREIKREMSMYSRVRSSVRGNRFNYVSFKVYE